jgi:hypothetical protein
VPTRERVHGVLRVAVALLAAVAITYRLARLQGHASFGGPGNFFSFFVSAWRTGGTASVSVPSANAGG